MRAFEPAYCYNCREIVIVNVAHILEEGRRELPETDALWWLVLPGRVIPGTKLRDVIKTMDPEQNASPI
jgi:hypothetical protein